MTVEIYVILVIALLAACYLLVPPIAGAFVRYRGKRLITCPETRKPAAVDVDATHAALTALTGHPDLRLKTCTRWPERQDCGQECLLQVELSPEDCLVRHILTSWYEGKHCVWCGRKFGAIQWSDHKPALLSEDGKSLEWQDVAPEKIPDVLATHFPVCWDCHITRTFCREHPEMVVDRSYVSAGVHREMQR
ncbi:MAG TPA: hypothetical protein VLM38_21245 [Blastocatellia bacterium]|nr:hypothetical protein [Blastocatellia bacterium]